MSKKELNIAVFCFIIGGGIIASIANRREKNYKSQIENLNKQIELLECYKENYLIMADSIQNIHVKYFKIGE